MKRPLLAFAACLTLAAPLAPAQPVRLIFDTDMGNDIDDAVALAMIHAFESRHEAKLLAVTVTKDNRWAAPFIDAMNTFYGRPDIPIGTVRDGKTPEDADMIRLPCERTRPDGSPVYPRRLMDGHDAPEATELLRRVLAAEKNGAVTVVQVGFSTNLARLIADAPGRDLVQRKVRLLVLMGGAFPRGQPEYNIKMDIRSARKLFAEWPTPIVASGFEVGNAILYPGSSILHDFDYAADHPLVDAWKSYQKMPYNRPTWDPTAALYAVRPDSFTASAAGTISVDAEGRTHFAAGPGGKHRYLLLAGDQGQRALRAMIDLAKRPPEPSKTRVIN
jgi:inosine-uridine nucleoside N-ribohydrolase